MLHYSQPGSFTFLIVSSANLYFTKPLLSKGLLQNVLNKMFFVSVNIIVSKHSLIWCSFLAESVKHQILEH